jgi:hypothetical protein
MSRWNYAASPEPTHSSVPSSITTFIQSWDYILSMWSFTSIGFDYWLLHIFTNSILVQRLLFLYTPFLPFISKILNMTLVIKTDKMMTIIQRKIMVLIITPF